MQQANCLTVGWLRGAFRPFQLPPMKPDIKCAGWAPGFRARSLCSLALLPVSPARPNYTRIHSRIFASSTCWLWESDRPLLAFSSETFDLLEWACSVATQAVCSQAFKRSNQPGTLLPRRANTKTGRHVFGHFLVLQFDSPHWKLITRIMGDIALQSNYKRW